MILAQCQAKIKGLKMSLFVFFAGVVLGVIFVIALVKVINVLP
ncbi:hypothetical protein [Helicobacter pullorum]|nr:hypothetical protein [Helicobacter pullorum]